MGSVPDCQSQELLQLSRHYTLHRSRSSRVRTHQRSRVIAANCWAIIHQSEAALARVPSQWEGGEAAGARMRGGRESPEQTGGGAPGRGPRGRSAGDKRPGAAQSWPGVQGVQTQSRASCSVLFSGHLLPSSEYSRKLHLPSVVQWRCSVERPCPTCTTTRPGPARATCPLTSWVGTL